MAFHIGDKVAYGFHTLKEFDLVKGKYGLLDIYNVLGSIRDSVPDSVQKGNDTYVVGTDLRPGAYDK